MDEWIDRLINNSLATFAGRIAWAVASLAVIYACITLLAALIGGLS